MSLASARKAYLDAGEAYAEAVERSEDAHASTDIHRQAKQSGAVASAAVRMKLAAREYGREKRNVTAAARLS